MEKVKKNVVVPEGHYKVNTRCANCLAEQQNVIVPKGKPVRDLVCPECAIQSLIAVYLS